MGRPRETLLTIALAVLGLPPLGQALAHEGHHHTAMGTVKAVEAAQLDLETKDGAAETFVLTEATVYKRGDAAAGNADVEVGERAVVMYETKEGRNLAIEVRLGVKKSEGQGG